MTREQQQQIVAAIFDDAGEQIISKIVDGKIPEEWDGIELRWFCRDYVAEHYVIGTPSGNDPRYRAYRNEVATRSL